MMYIRYREKEEVVQMGIRPDSREGVCQTLEDGVAFRQWGAPAFVTAMATAQARQEFCDFVQDALNVDYQRLGFQIYGSLHRRSTDDLQEALLRITQYTANIASARNFAYFALSATLCHLKPLKISWNAEISSSLLTAGTWFDFSKELARANETEFTLHNVAFTTYTLAEGGPPQFLEAAALTCGELRFQYEQSEKDWEQIFRDMTGRMTYRTLMTRALEMYDYLLVVLAASAHPTASPAQTAMVAFAINENPGTQVLYNLKPETRASVQAEVIDDMGSIVHTNAPPPPAQLATIMPGRAEQNAIRSYLASRDSLLTRWGYKKMTGPDVQGQLHMDMVEDGAHRPRLLIVRSKAHMTKAPPLRVVNIVSSGPTGEVDIRRLISVALAADYQQAVADFDVNHVEHSSAVATRAMHGVTLGLHMISSVPDSLLRLYASNTVTYKYIRRQGYRFELSMDNATPEMWRDDEVRSLMGVSATTQQATNVNVTSPLLPLMLLAGLQAKERKDAALTEAPRMLTEGHERVRINQYRVWMIPRQATVPIGFPGFAGQPAHVANQTVDVLDDIHDQRVPAAPTGAYYTEQNLAHLAHTHFSAHVTMQSIHLANNVQQTGQQASSMLSKRFRAAAVHGLRWQVRRNARYGQLMPLVWNAPSDMARSLYEGLQQAYWLAVMSGSPGLYYSTHLPFANPQRNYFPLDLLNASQHAGVVPLDALDKVIDGEANAQL